MNPNLLWANKNPLLTESYIATPLIKLLLLFFGDSPGFFTWKIRVECHDWTDCEWNLHVILEGVRGDLPWGLWGEIGHYDVEMSANALLLFDFLRLQYYLKRFLQFRVYKSYKLPLRFYNLAICSKQFNGSTRYLYSSQLPSDSTYNILCWFNSKDLWVIYVECETTLKLAWERIYDNAT